MKQIDISTPTHPNTFTLVDDADFEELSKHKWCVLGKENFAVRKKNKSLMLMHRQIMNTPKGMETDHTNHDTLDNRRCNLRICNRSQNQHNQKIRKTGTSKYKGVHWCKFRRKWQVMFCIENKKTSLGRYYNEIEAAKVYDAKALEVYGEFACVNFNQKGELV